MKGKQPMDDKIIYSYWGISLECEMIKQNSNVLVVLLPGIGYSLDRPLLDYSKKLALQLGYDVLPIKYGFQIAGKKLDRENELKYIIQESMGIFKIAMNDDYKKVIFISKSIGTIVHACLCNKVKTLEIKNIYLTPINETLNYGIEEDSLIITGTMDPLINKETVKEIKKIKDVSVIQIENGDHSLNIKNDVLSSIEVLCKVIEAEKKYLNDLESWITKNV
ncbi:alpha/beta hydrolase [Clostridium sp. LS]|uniref:alpha/beta hydrolase n=2 Tax=unclassified Clostridium TaxID=2614128 RepID=UPI001FA89785|nr:alpha/beta hydrolase [Clostridium sp. LS]